MTFDLVYRETQEIWIMGLGLQSEAKATEVRSTGEQVLTEPQPHLSSVVLATYTQQDINW